MTSAVVDSGRSRAQRIGLEILKLPIRFCVALAVLVVPPLATAIAKSALGNDPSRADVLRLGYGLPAMEDGRWWTPVTGALVAGGLTVSFVPGFSFVGVALLEYKAKHWRAAVAFVGGQLLGVLLAILLFIPLKEVSGAFALEATTAIDFGYSVGGFAALGMWTGYLDARLRRPLVCAVSCYLAAQLLFSGLVFDVSHPIGWTLGIVVGAYLMRPAKRDHRPVRLPADAIWIAVGAVLGSAVGVFAAWGAGGVGGIFGWGPGR